ncbi:WapI family immunity protein [Photobacterium kasasachensis]|uniref:WapI family immunity protein n=1 Tax=Photobacterium kasasachensis TaxID=2910240 RepID=UPI003D11B0DF
MKLKSINTTMLKLLTNDDKLVFEMTNFELFRGSSFKCRVLVSSRGFGYCGQVYFDNGQSFVEDIEKMAENIVGSAELIEDYHDHFVKFEVTKLGHVLVSGCFTEYGDFTQNLEFGFKIDQTCLVPFANDLRNVLQGRS